MAEDTEEPKKKKGFFRRLLKITAILAAIGAALMFWKRKQGADLDDVEKLIAAGAPLRVLRQVSSPGTQWVASTNVEPALLTAIQQSLLSLTDNNILAGISRGLTGFRAVTAADYDELEQQMQQAALFDR